MDRTVIGKVPHPLILQGRAVRLEPLERSHIPALMEVALATPEEFLLTNTPLSNEERDAYFDTVLAQREAGSAYPFTIMLQATGEVIGSTRFSAMDWKNRNTQLGYTWFRKDQHGTAVNLDSKLLMLSCAFEQLQLHRVSIRTDVRNERSRRAILGLGATQEGVLRRHMVTRTGAIRDTALFSIIDLEWPEVKKGIESRLEERLARQLSGSRAVLPPGPRDQQG
jgi:RimJ/RimL family protein N-acetyltransferase